MIQRLITHALNGVAYIRKHPQLFMTFILVLVIPCAFLFSAQQFLHVSRLHQEQLEQERIGIVHSFFAGLLASNTNESLQGLIDRLIKDNKDFVSFRILVEEGNSLRIVASNAAEEVGMEVTKDRAFGISATSVDDWFVYPRSEGSTQ